MIFISEFSTTISAEGRFPTDRTIIHVCACVLLRPHMIITRTSGCIRETVLYKNIEKIASKFTSSL